MEATEIVVDEILYTIENPILNNPMKFLNKIFHSTVKMTKKNFKNLEKCCTT